MMKLPHERLENESSLAHAAFLDYLDLGHERSLSDVSQKLEKSLTVLKEWSTKWNWVARARDYDARRLRLVEEAKEAGIRATAADWVTRRDETKGLEWVASTLLLKRVLEFLESKSAKCKNFREAAQVLELASKVARLATGLATEHNAVKTEEGWPQKIDISAALERVYGRRPAMEPTAEATRDVPNEQA